MSATFVRSSTNSDQNGPSSISASIDVADNGLGNRMLFIVAHTAGSGSPSDLGTIVFDPGGGNEVQATELVKQDMTAWNDDESGIFYVLEADLPASGTFSVQMNITGGQEELAIGISLYEDVDQTTPFGTPVTESTTDGNYESPAVSGEDGDLVVDFYRPFKDDATPGGGQTIRFKEFVFDGGQPLIGTEKTLSGSTSTTFTHVNTAGGFDDHLVWGGVALKQAAGGEPEPSFTPQFVGVI